MHFWDTRKLTEELSNSLVTEKLRMHYLLAGQVLFTFVIYQALYTSDVIDSFFIVEFLTVLAVVFLGVLKCYKVNGGSHGSNLVEYFVCLSVPLTIKITILVYGLFYIYHFVGGYGLNYFTSTNPQYIHDYVTFVISVFGQALFFLRMKSHIAKINQLRPSS